MIAEQPDDTIFTSSPYVEELKAAVLRLDRVEAQNTHLTIALVALVVAVAVAILIILVYIRKTRKRDRLTGQLLKSHAQTLPGFTSTVNQLSGKSIKLSLALYEEFQDAINAIKEQQHNSQAVIVNDKQFAADYPKIANMTNLSAQEKLVTVLYQEGFDANQISLFMGISAASVRAIKSRVKTKTS